MLAAGRRIAVLAPEALTVDHENLLWSRASADAAQFANDLYARLRELDAMGCDLILVAAPPANERWRAVIDRLRRAAAGSK